jgi:hypothetical protein
MSMDSVLGGQLVTEAADAGAHRLEGHARGGEPQPVAGVRAGSSPDPPGKRAVDHDVGRSRWT